MGSTEKLLKRPATACEQFCCAEYTYCNVIQFTHVWILCTKIVLHESCGVCRYMACGRESSMRMCGQFQNIVNLLQNTTTMSYFWDQFGRNLNLTHCTSAWYDGHVLTGFSLSLSHSLIFSSFSISKNPNYTLQICSSFRMSLARLNPNYLQFLFMGSCVCGSDSTSQQFG